MDDFGFPEPLPAEQPAAPPAAPPPRPRAPEVQPLPLTLAPLPARTASPTAARAKAGLGFVAAAAGVGLGGVLAGPLGALAGLAGVGTVRNLYRSQGVASSDPAEQGDAARSLALGVVGLGIVGFLGYKIWNSNKDDE